MWNQKGQQACKLELQAGADPKVLRQNFFLLQEDSVFALKFLVWMDEATSVEGDLLYFSSDDGHEYRLQHTFTAISGWVFGWITGDWPSQGDTENWPSQYMLSFLLWKILIFVLLLHFEIHLDVHWKTFYVGNSLLGKKGYVLKILKFSMPSPNL